MQTGMGIRTRFACNEVSDTSGVRPSIVGDVSDTAPSRAFEACRDCVKTTALVITVFKARSKCSFTMRKLRFFATFRLRYPDCACARGVFTQSLHNGAASCNATRHH